MNARAVVRAAISIAIACSLAREAFAREVQSVDPPFRARVPDEFEPLDGTRDAVFVFASNARDGVPRVITLRPLPGRITQDAIDVPALQAMVHSVSPAARIRVAEQTALGVEVPLVVGSSGESDSLALAQLPTTPRALQLIVTGPAGDDAHVEQIARDVMTSMNARTNWLSRAERMRRRIAQVLTAISWALLAAYAIAWALRFRRAPQLALQRRALIATALSFGLTALLFASVRHATSFEPITPALVAIVLFVNAMQLRGERVIRSEPNA